MSAIMRLKCVSSFYHFNGMQLSCHHVIHHRHIFSVVMSTKFVEYESERLLKRKRGYSHNQRKDPVDKGPKPDKDDITESDYYFENGLRKVYPYFYNLSTFVKDRWVERTIHDVFTTEFKPVHSVEDACERGLLTVNGEPVRANFVLKHNMLIEHRIHRHENPVVAAPIEVVADMADLLVINKPSSIPVHPCGRYRLNSITMLLWKEYGYNNLHPLYRLDRLTSGVLMLPKRKAVFKKMDKQFSSKQLRKEYVCRVEGRFPDGTIECKEPIGCLSYHIVVQGVRQDGKESHTTFTRLSYNGRSSVVRCIAHTGRTHQIRVHLQFLGHPILNDQVYNNTAFGPDKGKGGKIDKSLTELELILGKWHNSSEWVIEDNPEYEKMFGRDMPISQCDADIIHAGSRETVHQANECTGGNPGNRVRTAEDWEAYMASKPFEQSKQKPEKTCHTCRWLYREPTRRELVLFLHAYRYTVQSIPLMFGSQFVLCMEVILSRPYWLQYCPDWDYSTPQPDWARDDWADEDSYTLT